jgi:hypothetical protein
MFQQVGLKRIPVSGTRTIASTDGWNSRQFTNNHHKGVFLVVDRISETGTATLNGKIQYKNDTTGEWIDLEGAAFGEWADGTSEPRALTVYPGITAADADANIALDTDNHYLCGQFLPRHWRVALTTTGTTNVVSVDATMLP